MFDIVCTYYYIAVILFCYRINDIYYYYLQTWLTSHRITESHAMAFNKDLNKPLKKRKAVEIVSAFPNDRVAIDLQEWIGSSVLARYSSVYRPGKIVGCLTAGSVKVLLDKQTEPIVYNEVLSTLDILGHHSPAAVLVTEGLSVCVKERQEDNVYVVSKIKQVVVGPPLKCLVESESLPEDIWVNRANIRLMQPPWYDDLRGAGQSQLVSFIS